jgi:NAD(P)-dependent dehydrogenase (short-subunit alcohol dehydrogenase family)
MTILITGANRGIGRALLDGYRARGQSVVGTTRSATPDEGDWITLDVAHPESVEDLRNTWGSRPLDLLVCNAGIYQDRSDTLEAGFASALWSETFAVNVTGVFLTIQAMLPALGRAAPSKIAIISSQMGSSERASGGSYIYRASKAAAVNLGRNLAVDLAGRGISVGIYHPGWVRTDMGGESAAIGTTEAAAGLIERFDALGPANTGCFETWDGRPHPY